MNTNFNKRLEILLNNKQKLIVVFLVPTTLATLVFMYLNNNVVYASDNNLAITSTSKSNQETLPIPIGSSDTIVEDLTKSLIYEQEQIEIAKAEEQNKKSLSDDEAFKLFVQPKELENKSISTQNSENQYKSSFSSDNLDYVKKQQQQQAYSYTYNKQEQNAPIEITPTSTKRSRLSNKNNTPSSEASNEIIGTAVIHNWNQEIRSNSSIRIRTTSKIQYENIEIPQNTILSGIASLQSERMLIKITAVNINNHVYPIKLSVCELDGVEGLYLPTHLGTELTRESTDKGAEGVKTNINIPAVGDLSFDIGKKIKNNPSFKIPDGYKILIKKFK